MPRVTTNDGILKNTVTAPFTKPTAAPNPSAATTATITGWWCSRQIAAMSAQTQMSVAYDRSISPVQMTKTVVTAITVTAVVVSTMLSRLLELRNVVSRSRTPKTATVTITATKRGGELST